jgi:hypothetical protein
LARPKQFFTDSDGPSDLRATWHRFWLALGSEDLKADSARAVPELQYIHSTGALGRERTPARASPKARSAWKTRASKPRTGLGPSPAAALASRPSSSRSSTSSPKHHKSYEFYASRLASPAACFDAVLRSGLGVLNLQAAISVRPPAICPMLLSVGAFPADVACAPSGWRCQDCAREHQPVRSR